MPQLKDIAKNAQHFRKKDYRSYDIDAKLPNNKSNTRTCEEINKHTPCVNITEISPSMCKPWFYADRDKHEMGNIEELANSIKSNGQQEPALVRPILSNQPDEKIKYEVIFGHRRWLACSLCKHPLLAMVKQLTDQEAAIAQKEENENREDLSDFARAMNYKKLLDNSVFSSASELAANFDIKTSTLSDILAYTKLPPKLISSLEHPHLLPKRTAVKLVSLCKNISDKNLEKLCTMLPHILSGKIPFNKLSDDLFTDNSSKASISKPTTKQFTNSLSVKLFTSGYNQNNSPCFTFHKIVSDNKLIAEIETMVLEFLKKKTEAQTDENNPSSK